MRESGRPRKQGAWASESGVGCGVQCREPSYADAEVPGSGRTGAFGRCGQTAGTNPHSQHGRREKTPGGSTKKRSDSGRTGIIQVGSGAGASWVLGTAHRVLTYAVRSRRGACRAPDGGAAGFEASGPHDRPSSRAMGLSSGEMRTRARTQARQNACPCIARGSAARWLPGAGEAKQPGVGSVPAEQRGDIELRLGWRGPWPAAVALGGSRL